jgi:hypothetical protein
MKIILLDLTETDYNNYDTDTLYVDTVYALGDSYGWITRRQDTFRDIDVPFDFRGRKYRRFEVDLSSVNPSLGTGYWGRGDNFLNQGTTGNFIDVPSFGQDGYDTFTIKWTDMGGADMYYYRGYNDNNVFLGSFYINTIGAFFRNNTTEQFTNNTVGYDFQNNTVGNNFYNNTVGNNFFNSTVGNNFYNNTVGNNFTNNTVGEGFQYSTVGNNFYNNTVGNNFNNNTVGNLFNSNTVGNSFNNNTVGKYFQSNTVGNSFFNNTVGYNFQSNTVGNDFRSNTITGNLSSNTIGNNFQFNEISGFLGGNTIGNFFQRNKIDRNLLNGTNFTTATHVYGDYTCQIFIRSDNTFQLSYIDGTNTIQYAAVNA